MLFPAAFAGCALAAACLVALLVRFAPRVGLLDRPNERSLHTRLTPRGGGIGFVLVTVTGAPLLLRMTGAEAPRGLVAVLVLGFALAALSLWDDRQPVSAGWRLAAHVLLGALTVVLVGWLDRWSWPGVNGVKVLQAEGAAVVTVVWIVGMTNVFNFMDGIDGIAGLQGLVTGLVWGVVGVALGTPAAAAVAWALAGGCAGFLVFNWSPARIFMGDVGSAFLGYVFAVVPLLALAQLPAGAPVAGRLPVFAALAAWPFLADGAFTFLRRLRRGENVLQAHRSHLYQRLVLAGWPHARVSALYGAWAAAMGAVALAWLRGGTFAWVVGPLLAAGSLFAVWLLVVRIEAARSRPA